MLYTPNHPRLLTILGLCVFAHAVSLSTESPLPSQEISNRSFSYFILFYASMYYFKLYSVFIYLLKVIFLKKNIGI